MKKTCHIAAAVAVSLQHVPDARAAVAQVRIKIANRARRAHGRAGAAALAQERSDLDGFAKAADRLRRARRPDWTAPGEPRVTLVPAATAPATPLAARG